MAVFSGHATGGVGRESGRSLFILGRLDEAAPSHALVWRLIPFPEATTGAAEEEF